MTAHVDKPTPHSPALAYVLVWLTAGLYFFYWMYRMMRDVNRLSSSQVFAARRIICVVAVYVLVYVAVFSQLLTRVARPESAFSHFTIGLFFVGWFMALGWLCGLAYLHAKIGKSISLLQAQQGLPSRASPGLSVLLFLLYFAVVPYLQSQMNSLLSDRKQV